MKIYDKNTTIARRTAGSSDIQDYITAEANNVAFLNTNSAVADQHTFPNYPAQREHPQDDRHRRPWNVAERNAYHQRPLGTKRRILSRIEGLGIHNQK
jgi:hypothetical protein